MALSFSGQVKNEICGAKLSCKNCGQALLYGMLLFCRGVSVNEVLFNTESKASANLFTQLLVDETGSIVTVSEPDLRNRTNRPIYSVTIDDQSDREKLLSQFFPYWPKDREYIHPVFFQKECCKKAFLRGAYLSCGTMINPNREYHLEFLIYHESLCREFQAFLQEFELDFHRIKRSKGYSLYIKESEQIEDTLAHLGAVKASMELMNLKIEKELRNQANRVTNCETANIEKAVSAAMQQIQKISKLQKSILFQTLPPPLMEAAELRLAHPEMSLRELCELDGGKLSRSGLNHRLQKLCKLADKL